MNPEKQRIAIAEACGWTPVAGVGWSHSDLPPAANIYGRVPPDYLNDLNAMHEAEKVLTFGINGNRLTYLQHLHCIVDGPSTFSTAAQRAEAFLRCLGKWEEAP